jgi:hypothetical protein
MKQSVEMEFWEHDLHALCLQMLWHIEALETALLLKILWQLDTHFLIYPVLIAM